MKVDVENLSGGKKKITIEVAVADLAPYLDRAIGRLAAKHQISGFRPGKAPDALIRSRFGEDAILEEALQEVVPRTLYEALRGHSVDSVGPPDVSVEKLAPGNPVVYSAVVSAMPDVTLGDWRSIHVERKPVVVTDADVDAMVDELREMQASEVIVLRPAATGDRVEVNFEITRDGVSVEGGTGTKFSVILGRQTLIPGFEEQLIGAATGERRKFRLTFPKPYFQESLAGAEADFAVEVVSIYSRTLPEKNDEWAMRIVNKPYGELLSMFRDNLRLEKEAAEASRLERAVVEELVKKATFGEIPEILLTAEKRTMIAELQDDIARRGMEWKKYVQSIRKTEQEIEKEFEPGALVRVQGALVLRALARELSLQPSDDEIAYEIKQHKEQHQDDAHTHEHVDSPEFKQYVTRMLTNRKVLETVVSLLAK